MADFVLLGHPQIFLGYLLVNMPLCQRALYLSVCLSVWMVWSGGGGGGGYSRQYSIQSIGVCRKGFKP